MNGTKHSMIAQYTRVYEDKMAMGEHKHLIFPWHSRLEAKHGETNKQRSMSVSCSQTILMISHHLPCWKNVDILLLFLPSALFLKQSWSLIGVEMWWLWSYGHGAAENSPLWGKKVSVVGVLKWYPKKSFPCRFPSSVLMMFIVITTLAEMRNGKVWPLASKLYL